MTDDRAIELAPLQTNDGGPRLGRYVLGERIGEGETGAVYKARPCFKNAPERTVAIKWFHAPMAAPAISDARVWAWMGHPNLVQVHEMGESEGRPFLVMELLEGTCLRALLVDLLAQQRQLPVPLALCVAAQVARGLTHAQARVPDEDRASLTHIDVTPSNIMVLRDGEVKLLDSGILGSDELVPTMLESGPGNVRLSYWAPERLLWRRERRSDLFSLGVVLWESLIGRSLFRTGMPAKTLDNLVQRVIPPPSHFRAEIPAALDRVVLGALERNPEQRPASAEALADDLEALLDADPRPSLASLMEELAAGGPSAQTLPLPSRTLPLLTRMWPLPTRTLPPGPSSRTPRPLVPGAARRIPLMARVSPAVALAGLAVTVVSLAVGWLTLARAPAPAAATMSSATRGGSGARSRVLIINAINESAPGPGRTGTDPGAPACHPAPGSSPARGQPARGGARGSADRDHRSVRGGGRAHPAAGGVVVRGRLEAALVVLGLGSGCRDPADVTGFRVAATWAGFEPDQLSYVLSTEDGSPLGEPERRPGNPGGPLSSGMAVVVYLAHERDGQAVRCTIEALAAAKPLARGSATATVVGHRLVDLTVDLIERIPVPTLEGVIGDAGALPDADPAAADAPAPALPDGAMAVSEVGANPDVAVDRGPLSPEAAPPDMGVVGPDAPAVLPEPPPSDGPVAPPDLAVDTGPAPKESGQPCALAGECLTGFCSGGVCCAEACTSPCRSCAGAQPGTCLPRPAGANCALAGCDDNTFKARAASTCDGQGTCIPGAVTSCAPYRCEGAICSTRCNGPSSCTPGWTCLAHTCRMSAP